MKKISYLYIALAIFLSSLISLVPSTQAWSNGKPGPPSTYSSDLYKYIPDWQKDHTSFEQLYYGTHDWIAEYALALFVEKSPDSIFVNKIWYNEKNLKMWLLLGTEAPDAIAPFGRDFADYIIYPATDCGYTITGSDIHYYNFGHNLYFSGGQMTGTNLAEAAHTVFYDKITIALQEGDCQRAAFFIGVLFHYIADAAFYPHLISTQFGQTVHTYQRDVYWVTCKKYIQRGNNPFFNIDEARTYFTSTTTENPWYATLYAGLDVRYGNSYGRSFTPTLYKDAYWCHDKSPTSTYGSYWGTTDHTIIRQYTYNDRPTSGDGKTYFDTIEHHLNVAVYYCAAVLNFVSTYYYKCDCQGLINPNPDPNPNWNSDPVGDAVSQYEFLFVTTFMGFFWTVLAMGVAMGTSKLISLPVPF